MNQPLGARRRLLAAGSLTVLTALASALPAGAAQALSLIHI